MNIFVTVGSMYPMDRVVNEIDQIAKTSKHKFFCQTGNSRLMLKNTPHKKFISYDELQSKLQWADIVISHAGAGSIIDAIAANKKLILIPRLKEFNEAVDDHQIEICKKMNERFGINYSKNEKELGKLINKSAHAAQINRQGRLAKEIKKLTQ